MAKAAQRARVPYTLSVAGGTTIEQAAEAVIGKLDMLRVACDKCGGTVLRAVPSH